MPKKTSNCPHCQSGPQTYRYLKRQYIFDVDLAKKIVNDGRVAVELEEDDVRHSVNNSRIYPQHLEHVDTRYPGVVAHLWYPAKDGRLVHAHQLIDGNHRAARCLQLGLPYYVHLLTEEESLRILLKSPTPLAADLLCNC